jgi:glyoxylase-like metal-dependent hydrolase (beta-lactamase superfamily II)
MRRVHLDRRGPVDESDAMTLPSSLSGPEATGAHANVAVAQFELGSTRNFVYLLLDWTEKKAAWVDPQKDLAPPLQALKQHGFTLSHVLLTHTHHDHVAGLDDVLAMFPGVKAQVHAMDAHRLDGDARLAKVKDGDVIKVGALEVRVMHTPGHSAGECCFFVDGKVPLLFTGDTLFIRDCGRTDLETGNTAEMFASLQRIKTLPPATVILPGHHYARECASTLEKELLESGPLKVRSVEELGQLP